MLKLITAKTSVLLPGGIIMKAGDSFMCETAFADKLIAAESAIEAEKTNKTPENNADPKPLEDMTINELKETAEQNNIQIPEDLTKKADIYAAVKASLEFTNAQNV